MYESPIDEQSEWPMHRPDTSVGADILMREHAIKAELLPRELDSTQAIDELIRRLARAEQWIEDELTRQLELARARSEGSV